MTVPRRWKCSTRLGMKSRRSIIDLKRNNKMIYENIQADIKSAMICKNTVKRDCLRSLVSEIKNQTINAGKEITEDIVLRCIQKSVKQHNDSIEQFTRANRDDLVLKEIEEKKYLEVYLPRTLDENETFDVIATILQTIEPFKKNMGTIMRLLPKEVDRGLASKLLKEILK